MADYTGMRVADLQQELRHRGLPTSGRKAELLARLQSATARVPARASQPRHQQLHDCNHKVQLERENIPSHDAAPTSQLVCLVTSNVQAKGELIVSAR